LARRLDRIEPCAAPFPAERLEFLDARALAEIIAENRDVDVFGKPGDQAERLRERRSTLE
jgi:hypothetical protein